MWKRTHLCEIRTNIFKQDKKYINSISKPRITERKREQKKIFFFTYNRLSQSMAFYGNKSGHINTHGA